MLDPSALHDPHLRDVLVELDRLRARDEMQRKASDSIAGALQLLVEARDADPLPLRMAARLAAELQADSVALCPCASSHGECSFTPQADPALIALIRDPALLAYLAQKPQRLIQDVGAILNGLPKADSLADLSLNLATHPPRQLPAVLLSGRVQFDDQTWLVLCAGTPLLATPDAFTLFQRYLPVFAHTLQRHTQGRLALERERRERHILLEKEKAEAASVAKSEFVSRMSHELRTPLNAIIGFAALLKDEPLSGSQRHYLELIETSGDHLLDLINMVLDHSKIAAGKMVLEHIAFDLHSLIESVVSMIGQQASQKGLLFHTPLTSSLPTSVQGDPTRLRQIFLNLLSNAVKFTPKGAVSFAVSLTQTGVLHFKISDTGVGMDESVRSRLFKAFSQADESIAREFGGTGLGLLISRDLLHAMGGSIDFESSLGVGTSFWGTAQLVIPAPSASAQLAAAPSPSSAAWRLKGRRILVVDDNNINRKLANAMLARLGVEIALAEDGKAGLELMQSQRFDAVLMDVEMPVMNGFAATQAWRAHERKIGTARLPIIALTANAMAEDQARCFAIGMDGYVAKPMGMLQLQSELLRLLDKQPE
jgi:signal transduction histidine kinase/ActR/RegA family two-component response regulator